MNKNHRGPTIQVIRLKGYLKEIGAKPGHTKRLSVRVERRHAGYHNGKAIYEYGHAKSHLLPLTEEQISKLKSLEPHIKISNFPIEGFCIVTY